MKRLIDFIGVALVVTIVVCLVYGLKTRDEKPSVVRDTVYRVIHDTVRVSEPVAVDEKVVGEIVVPVGGAGTKGSLGVKGSVGPVGSLEASGTDEADSVTMTMGNDCEMAEEKDSIVLPLTQRVYRDSNYIAYVSGYQAKLDSFLIFGNNKEIVFSERIVPKRKKWSVGLCVGYGMGKGGRGFFVGASVQRKIWEF